MRLVAFIALVDMYIAYEIMKVVKRCLVIGEDALTEKSHEIHMWILCVVLILHVLSTYERNAKR